MKAQALKEFSDFTDPTVQMKDLRENGGIDFQSLQAYACDGGSVHGMLYRHNATKELLKNLQDRNNNMADFIAKNIQEGKLLHNEFPNLYGIPVYAAGISHFDRNFYSYGNMENVITVFELLKDNGLETRRATQSFDSADPKRAR